MTATPVPGLHIVGGASRTDTISAILDEPLAVMVVDTARRPASGSVVRFEAVPVQGSSSPDFWYGQTSVAREGTSLFQSLVIDTTDANGRAAALVQFGTVAGHASVLIQVPELGLADTAHYVVSAGAAYKVVVTPLDSAVYVGEGYVLTARSVDRGGNARSSDPITFSVASGPVTVDLTTGALTAAAFGRAAVIAHVDSVQDTAWVSVVPRAWVAAQQHDPGNGGPVGIFLIQLDGSGRQALAAGLDNAWVSGQGFGWSADGNDLAIARGRAINLVSPGAAEHQLIDAGGTVLLGARFSRDGQWIYFARAGAGIFRVRHDGSGLQHLGRGGTEWGEDYRPAPSHDGRSIVYGSYRSPCGVDDCIRVLDIETNADRAYGGRGYLVRGTNAAWSPTDDLIAYASDDGVGLIRSDGTGQRVFAADVRYVGWMDWSPDGRWLLVSPGSGPVLLFDVRSGMRMPIPTLGTYGATAWRP